MASKDHRNPKPIANPDGLAAYQARYFENLKIKNYSRQTIERGQRILDEFIAWCEQRSLQQPNEITKPILESYQRYLYRYRKRNGQPLAFSSQHTYLVVIRAWFKWLARHNHLLYNPASELDLPRLGRRLPKHILNREEVEAVMRQPDIEDPLGLRDRAILETFYSSGLRRMELIQLHCHDLDIARGTLMIRQGKGQKDRMVPIGGRAIAWTERYLAGVRPDLVIGFGNGVLYLSPLGEPLTPSWLSQRVRKYIHQADLGKTGACHLLRHTMATLMLENGADIRIIQEILGHVCISTTQIYTQVSIRQLKEAHSATHPGAAAETEGEADAARDDLLTALAAETEDDPEQDD